jgi:catechol 2,3-dioxygenase-like lactoylglutathione lyase family enzyme
MIDHFELTVSSLEATLSFYGRVLGMKRSVLPDKPASLVFGNQKINVHEVDKTFEPKAAHPTPGAVDFFLTVKVAR